MGFHTSYQLIDPILLTERLIPFILKNEDINDLKEESIRITNILKLTQEWRQKIYRLDGKIRSQQRELAPKITELHTTPIRKSTFFDRLLKREIPTETKEYQIHGLSTGIPGLETWEPYSRPFCISEGSPPKVIQDYQRFLNITDKAEESVTQLIKNFLDDLAEHRDNIDKKVSPEAIAVLENFPNFFQTLAKTPQEDRWPAPENEFLHLSLLREAWEKRDSDSIIDDYILGDCAPLELIRYTPDRIINAFSNLLPAWSVEGTTWISLLLDKVEIRIGDIMESPQHLFEKLTSSHKPLQKNNTQFHLDHLSYIPPEKMAEFSNLLITHKEALIHAQGHEDPSAWQAIAEPVHYAKEHQLGLVQSIG